MKTKTITIIAAILLCFANTADATIPATSLHFAPKPLKKVTITFAVEANCGDCKNRIESALDKKGVLKAVENVNAIIAQELLALQNESNIGDNKFRDIGLGKEAALIHPSSKEVESRTSNEGVIYIEEGCPR